MEKIHAKIKMFDHQTVNAACLYVSY